MMIIYALLSIFDPLDDGYCLGLNPENPFWILT